jgi:hypothetical protein
MDKSAIPEEKRKACSKLQPRAINSDVVGYTSENMYQIYDPNTPQHMNSKGCNIPFIYFVTNFGSAKGLYR